MNAETIKDYLVSLGFQVDEAGERKFSAVLAGVAMNAIKLGTAVEDAALSVIAFTSQIASGLDSLYQESRNTGATAKGIESISYAVSQLGGNVDTARTSLASLAGFVRHTPDAEGFLNRLGVQTHDVQGNMRDMAAIFMDVGQKLSSMPYPRANQLAKTLGIDENTLQTMRQGLGQFSEQYAVMAKTIDFNADKAAASSNVFMTSQRTFGEMMDMVRSKVGSDLAAGLAGNLDLLRKRILDNWPQIDAVLTGGINGILTAGDFIIRMVGRAGQAVGDITSWFQRLDPQGKQLIGVLGALGVAWRALNVVFAMTPLGMIVTAVTALGAALLLLYDDYKTWKKGGKSLIDWGKWKPVIDYAMKAFSGLGDSVLLLYGKAKALGRAILDVGEHLLKFLNIDTSKFSGKKLFDLIIDSAKNAMKVLGSMVDAIKKIIQGDFSGAFSSLKEAAITITQGPVAQSVAEVAQGAWNKLTNYFSPDEPAVKQPQSTTTGSQFIGWMQANGGDLDNVLAPYNWGLGNVQKHGMALMPKENQNYIPGVLSNMPVQGAQIQQQNTYHIYGGGNVRAVGNEVERRQLSANAQVMRGNQTKVG